MGGRLSTGRKHLLYVLAARLGDRARCETEGARGRAWALANLRHDDHMVRLEDLSRELVAESTG